MIQEQFAAELVIPSAAEMNSKRHNMQTLRQLCDSVGLKSDGRRYALVARLNQRREYRAWSDIVGPWTSGCTLSDAELKNVKKHSTENLRQRCDELGLHSDEGTLIESRPAMIASLNELRVRQNAVRDWHITMRKFLLTKQKTQNASADVSNDLQIPDGATTTSGNPNQPPAPMRCGAATEGLCALQGSSVSQVTRSADGRDMIEPALPSFGGAPTTSGNPNQPPAPLQYGAVTEGLCALQGSSGSQVTRSADGRDMIEPALPLIGWDPGRPNALHHLLTHPTLPRNHVTTTANFIVPLPTLNPSASMRDSQDTDHDVFACPSNTCGWDPGRLFEPPLLLMHTLPPTLTHPTLPRNDATTPESFSVPFPALNPSASMRDSQDTDHDVFARPSINCGWDPGRLIVTPLLLMHTLPPTTTVNISVPIPPLRVWRDEDPHEATARPLNDTCGWDPGGQQGDPLEMLVSLTHPTLPRNHATTPESFSIPFPALNPSASMRDSQDTDHDVFDKDAVEDGLSDCETVFACPGYDDDGSTFDDDIDVAGESSETCPVIWPTMIMTGTSATSTASPRPHEGDDWAVLEEDFEEDFDGDDLDTHEPGD